MTAVQASSRRSRSGTAPPGPIRCLVVDDHPAIRVGLSQLLDIESDFEVLDMADSAEAGLACAMRRRPDVAVVDYQLAGRSGLWLSRKLKRLPDPPAVLVYSACSDAVLSAACVVAEANGLVGKSALGADLCARIREVARGETHFPLVPPSLGDSMRRRLDPEEQAIFGMMLAGLARSEICRTLDLAPGELEAHQAAMLRKLERLDPPPRP